MPVNSCNPALHDTVWSILTHYESEDWLTQCQTAFPGVPDHVFNQVIEIFLGENTDDIWLD